MLNTESMTLTGNARYRVKRGWFRDHIVLQVEESGTVTEHFSQDPYSKTTKVPSQWRDATPQDLLQWVSVRPGVAK